MKTKTQLLPPVHRFALAALALLAMLWTIPLGQAQPIPTITLTQLLAQGFTNGPGALGYRLKVTGIRNVSSAVFEDIRREPTAGNAVQAHAGSVQLYGLNYVVAEASVDGGELSFSGMLALPPPLNDYAAMVTDLGGVVIGSSARPRFAVGDTFTIPRTFEIGPLTIDAVTLTINPDAQTFGGSALIGIGKGPSGSYCPPPFSPGPP